MANDAIEKYRHDLEVVRDTAAQVIKDFGLTGIEISFSGNPDTAYDELRQQVSPALKLLYNASQIAFMALLYRIDVEEKRVKAAAGSASGLAYFEALADLVLEREFTKVLFRKLYRHKNG